MARRQQLTMGTGLAAGQSTPVDWQGGEGMLSVGAVAWNGGSVKLQQMAPDGNYYTLQNYATTTPIGLTANGTANFRAPAGKLSLLIAAASGVSGWVIGDPANAAG